MLRASAAAFGADFDLHVVGDASVDPQRTDVETLMAFTDALVRRTSGLEDARIGLANELGPHAIAPAAAAAGNFEMMNRIVDGVGVAVSRSLSAIGPELGVTFDH